MNFKELLLIAGFALCTLWTIEYFVGGKKTDTQEQGGPVAGQSFIAPTTHQELKPVNTEVGFIDTKRPAAATLTEVETEHAQLLFSTDGASLERLRFKRQLGDAQSTLVTIFPPTDTERENRCFLVGLAEKTPYYYTLVDRVNRGDATDVIYEAETHDAVIRKTFTVYKTTYKLDMTLTVRPKHGNPVEARIFYPAPLMPDIVDRDLVSAVASDERGSIVKITRAKLDAHRGWFLPTLFGADNRYFVHAMVEDPDKFAQRAYFRLAGQPDLFSVLEGPAVHEERTWRLSFYFGPKESAAMSAVDKRLEQTFDYAGWLAPISKLLLAILVFLYGYLGNYGFAIIALTILVRLALLPFSLQSARSMSQGMKKNAEMQRKLQYIQQKYKDNPEQLAREREELIRKHGLPGLGGCLPMLLQLPVFFALSPMISHSIELYRAPFILWITDLSARDPYYILPAIVGGSMLLQSFKTVDHKQRLQMVMLALILGAFSSYWSAGLCLYLIVSTLLGVVQTMIQKRFDWA